MLHALKRSLGLFALLGAYLAPRMAEAAGDAARREADLLPAPSKSELGWYGMSVGLAGAGVTTAVGSAAPSELAEGESHGGGTYALHYEKQLFHCLGLRGFVHRAGWQTDLSEYGGDGDRVLYDLGAAPVCSFDANTGPHGLSMFVFVPASFSWSSAPARAPRELVLETTDVGTGYRIGLGVGMLIRLSRGVGLLLEVQGADQHVSHVRRYRLADGTGEEARLPIAYHLQWFEFSLGLAVLP